MRYLYLYTFVLLLCSVISSCSLKEDFTPIYNSNTLEVIGVPADYTRIKVGTKASISEEENTINDLTMVIFNSENKLAGQAFKVDGNISFTINLESGVVIYGENMISLGDNLTNCTIYMFANVWSYLQTTINNKGSDLTAKDLLDINIPVNNINIPDNGFPMVGVMPSVNLSSTGTSASINVPLKKLFAKINVSFHVNSIQVDKEPTFELTEWSVHNVPKLVSFYEPYDEENTLIQTLAATDSEQIFNTNSIEQPSEGQSIIKHSPTEDPDAFILSFYVPQHVVLPSLTENTYLFPDGLPISERQRYKPKMFSSNTYPTYVLVEGKYTDHYGQMTAVKYYLYLGQDNTDDFSIFRNQQLDNYIVIKGLTNSIDPADGGTDNISVDHRVEVTSKGYSVAIERETFIDSHFEVRPIDISVQAGAKLTLEIPNNTNSTEDDWIRFDFNDNVQEYFYSDLVTNDLKENTYFEIDNKNGTEEISRRLWLYIDENTNYYDKTISKETTDPELLPHISTFRENSVIVTYYPPEDADDSTPKQYDYKFRQMNLWRLWGGEGTGDNAGKNRFYDIEYYEEYLYNYASDDNWNTTTDGMPWGLDNISFSGKMGDDLKTQAIVAEASGTFKDLINNLINTLSPFYDFYLPREALKISSKLVKSANSFAGRRFTNAIIDYDPDGNNQTYAAISSIKRKLKEDSVSAIEYCLNKNKRNDNGLIDKNNRNWYLPAIDEIEEIMVSGYADFMVFQDKMYWSCQPTFYKNYLHFYSITEADLVSDYYRENPNGARATSAKYVGGNDGKKYTYTDSGIKDGYYALLQADVSDYWSESKEEVLIESKTISVKRGSIFRPNAYEVKLSPASYDEGYDTRNTTINRIRCVYNSGYKVKP